MRTSSSSPNIGMSTKRGELQGGSARLGLSYAVYGRSGSRETVAGGKCFVMLCHSSRRIVLIGTWNLISFTTTITITEPCACGRFLGECLPPPWTLAGGSRPECAHAPGAGDGPVLRPPQVGGVAVVPLRLSHAYGSCCLNQSPSHRICLPSYNMAVCRIALRWGEFYALVFIPI